MDSSQILLVHVLHVLHITLLHVLRHDGSGSYSKSPNRCHNLSCILCYLESFLRIFNPTNCKCFFKNKNNSDINFLINIEFLCCISREFQDGGCGITGSVQWPGLYMVWLFRNSEISIQPSMTVRRLFPVISEVTLDSSMTLWVFVPPSSLLLLSSSQYCSPSPL